MSTSAKLELAFDILARDKASKVMGDIGGKADTLGSKLGGIGGAAKLALGGAAAGGVAALGGALAQGVKDAASFEQLAAKTGAVIESTGNAANISVEGVQNLAASLENMSGVDEEEIINSQNVLATFTKIKNNGPDKVFDDAAAAALNMSVAMGTDLAGASLQVGKALNDPIAGLASLGRAGVQFTEAQKEQIKAMVEAGDTAGAQKIILGELETQFGGAAEAAGSGFSGSLARLNDALGDSFREIGEALLPILTDLAEWLAENLPGAIESFKSGLAIVSAFVKENVLPVLSDIGAFITEKVIPAMKDIWRVISEDVLPVLSSMATFFVDEVLPVLSDVASFIIDDVVPAVGKIATKIAEVVTTVGEKVDAVLGFFTGLAEDIAGIAKDIWDPLSKTFKGVINAILKAWNAVDFSISIKVPDWVPGIGGKGFNVDDVFPDVPTLHKGGTVTPWGIAPLRSDEIMAKLQVGETVIPRGAGTGGTTSYNVSIVAPAGTVRSERDLVREMRSAQYLAVR